MLNPKNKGGTTMKKDKIPEETKKNGMIAEIKKDMIRAEMDDGKTTMASKNDMLHQEGGKDIQAGEMKENKTPEEAKRELPSVYFTGGLFMVWFFAIIIIWFLTSC